MNNINKRNNIVFSLFIICGFSIIAYFLLSVGIYSNSVMINIMMPSAYNIFPGTDVNYAGKKVGIIQNLLYCKDTKNGNVYYYKAKAKIDGRVKIYDNDQIIICSAGILGEKSVNISPAKDHENSKKLSNNDIAYSKETNSMEDTATNMQNMAQSTTDAVDLIKTILSDHRKDIENIVGNLKEASGDFSNLSKDIKDSNIVTKSYLVSQKLDVFLSDMIDSLETLNYKNTWENIAAISENIKTITDSLSYISTSHNIDLAELATSINLLVSSANRAMKDNDSSIHQLLSSPHFYRLCIELLTRANDLVYDINKYGMFFTNNRSWQRERMNLLQAPKTVLHWIEKEKFN